MGIYIKIILFNYIINGVDSELNNFKKNIFGIESRNTIISILRTKYHQGIKRNDIKIYISSSTWRAVPDILGRDM